MELFFCMITATSCLALQLHHIRIHAFSNAYDDAAEPVETWKTGADAWGIAQFGWAADAEAGFDICNQVYTTDNGEQVAPAEAREPWNCFPASHGCLNEALNMLLQYP